MDPSLAVVIFSDLTMQSSGSELVQTSEYFGKSVGDKNVAKYKYSTKN